MHLGRAFGDTIFCDDIRQEVGDKWSFMGVYTGALVVPELPYLIPKLSLRIRYFEDVELGDASATIRVLGVGDGNILYEENANLSDVRREAKAMEEAGLLVGLPSDLIGQVVSEDFVVNFGNIMIEQTGYIRVRAYRGDAVVKLGAIRVTTQEELDSEDSVIAHKLAIGAEPGA